MKKTLVVLAVAAFMIACSDDGKLNKHELDKAGEKLQSTVEKGADTVGAKLKKLKNKLDKND